MRTKVFVGYDSREDIAWQVCRHVTSNAIVIAKEHQTIGIGAGQMSRVDAVKIALEAGVSAIIQPGGSKRDEEVVAAVKAAGAAMVFTERRHFRH